MQDREKKQYHNIIPIGNAFATLACGFSARLIVHFEQMPKRPPKHAVALLLYLWDWTQRNNLYNDNKNETIGVSLSVRELATHIGAKNAKTVYNGMKWLEREEWVSIDKGNNQTNKTVVIVNVDKVNQFASTDIQEKPPNFNYDYQQEFWENFLKNRCVKS